MDLGMSANMASITSKRKFKHETEKYHYVSLCKHMITKLKFVTNILILMTFKKRDLRLKFTLL